MLLVVLSLFICCRGPWHIVDIILDDPTVNSNAEHEQLDLSSFEADIVHHLTTLLVFCNSWPASPPSPCLSLYLSVCVCNSWATPVIYALFNVRIRQEVVDLLMCRPCRQLVTRRSLVVTGLSRHDSHHCQHRLHQHRHHNHQQQQQQQHHHQHQQQQQQRDRGGQQAAAAVFTVSGSTVL